MKAFTIIDALCTMGNTEGCGRFATPYEDDIIDFVRDMFGGGDEVEIDGEILENEYYIYSYGETLGNYVADAIVIVYDNKWEIINEIYLYKIE